MESATESRTRPWQGAALTDRDTAPMRELFALVFGAPMSEALWQWKYGHGRGNASGVWQGGTLLAHYGGTQRTLWFGERPIRGVQMGDVMVRRESRAVFSRHGPFATVARHFIDRHVGDGKDFGLGFGFPSVRHARLGELLGLYRALGDVYEIRWPARARQGWLDARWQLEPAEDTASAAARIDALWLCMRDALPGWVLPQRDGIWLVQRYARHPEHRYRIDWLRCRLSRRRVGALVIRLPTGAPAQATWEWMDWVGHPGYLSAALATARAAAASAGVPALHGWFSAPVANRFLQGADGASRITACSWCVTQHRATAVNAGVDGVPWWLTSGDTDFR